MDCGSIWIHANAQDELYVRAIRRKSDSVLRFCLMNKKKNVREKGGRNADNSDAETNTDQQRGLSKEAWIAIGTIVAALITGTVTVLIHVLPQASQPTPAA